MNDRAETFETVYHCGLYLQFTVRLYPIALTFRSFNKETTVLAKIPQHDCITGTFNHLDRVKGFKGHL